MRAPGKTDSTEPEAALKHPPSDILWTRWLQAMLENTHHLKKAIEAEDLEAGLKLAALRGQLIYDQLPKVWRFAPVRGERQKAKRFLEGIVLENQTFIEKLIGRCRERTEELKSVKRGRKALRLYRNPPPTTPRFLDRLG